MSKNNPNRRLAIGGLLLFAVAIAALAPGAAAQSGGGPEYWVLGQVVGLICGWGPLEGPITAGETLAPGAAEAVAGAKCALFGAVDQVYVDHLRWFVNDEVFTAIIEAEQCFMIGTGPGFWWLWPLDDGTSITDPYPCPVERVDEPQFLEDLDTVASIAYAFAVSCRDGPAAPITGLVQALAPDVQDALQSGRCAAGATAHEAWLAAYGAAHGCLPWHPENECGATIDDLLHPF